MTLPTRLIGVTVQVPDADHAQVLSVLTMVLDQIRSKHPGLTYELNPQSARG